MPDRQVKIPLYNLEARLQALGILDNSYVIGIFDGCRDGYCEDIFPPMATRGCGSNSERDDEIEEGRNVFLIFGCGPG